jgi:hypothetical protein
VFQPFEHRRLTAVSPAASQVAPPKCLRVGVTGHRVPPKLPAQSEHALRDTIDRLLSAIVKTVRQVESALSPGDERVPDRERSRFRQSVTKLAIVSSLAEGSDRIVAEAGIAAGFSLEVVLPFGRAEYVVDFPSAASRKRFEDLLARASHIFELSGDAGERPKAYEAAGLFMLARIDLLVAIWDGGRATGIGGTGQIIGRAIADGIPILRIDPINPNALQMLWQEASTLPTPDADGSLTNFRPADTATITSVIKKIHRNAAQEPDAAGAPASARSARTTTD